MRVPITLVLAALGIAAGACAAVERGPPVPDVVAPAPDAVTATGMVMTAGTSAFAVRRRFCRPQPWCRWGRLRGPSY